MVNRAVLCLCVLIAIDVGTIDSFFCYDFKKSRPRSTPFPFITLPPGATFPPATTASTATTTTAPSLIFVPLAPTTVSPNSAPLPTFPAVPITNVACPPALTLCAPGIPGAAATPTGTNGFGLLGNGCPCFDPRSSQAVSMIISAITRGDFNQMLMEAMGNAGGGGGGGGGGGSNNGYQANNNAYSNVEYG